MGGDYFMIMTAAELKAQRWVSIMMECKTSGQSVPQWCNEHGINEKQYWYYHRKLRNHLAQEVGNHTDIFPATLPPSSDVTFQELKKPIRHGSAHIQLGNHQIEIDEDISDELLLKIIQAVSHA